MSEQELRRAIERPAQLAGCEFEPGLVERLLREVKDQPGGLPLLQHALLELWGRRKGRRLTHAGYEAIGGVEGALERRAEAVYKRFSESERAICRRVFLRLTQPGEGTDDTKRRATLQELMPAEGERGTVEEVVRTLTREDARLVTIEGGEEPQERQFVEVAHEALIRGWSRLRGWVEEDRESLRIHRHLAEAANDWESAERDESFLHRGTRLAQEKKWAETHLYDLNPLERLFLDASAALQQQEREERAHIIAVAEGPRKRLARDLHDGPTQSIAAIAMRLNDLRMSLDREQDLRQTAVELMRIEELARRATKETRHLLFTLRPLILETEGLLAALEQYVSKLAEMDPTPIHLEATPEVEQVLDQDAQGIIFYIVDEAIRNARKYAKAKNIWVRLCVQDGTFVAEVEDDGVGFDVDTVQARYDQRHALGMINMYERAELIGGTLTIASAPGEGTRITLAVPLQGS